MLRRAFVTFVVNLHRTVISFFVLLFYLLDFLFAHIDVILPVSLWVYSLYLALRFLLSQW